MKSLNAYLSFTGNCEEAIHFYANALGGKIKTIIRFGEMPGDHSKGFEDKVMHAELEADGMVLMASDVPPSMPFSPGMNVSLSMQLDNETDQARIFNALAEGGTVILPLQDTMWNARFGMLKDKFGFRWLLNMPKDGQN